MASRSHISAT